MYQTLKDKKKSRYAGIFKETGEKEEGPKPFLF